MSSLRMPPDAGASPNIDRSAPDMPRARFMPLVFRLSVVAPVALLGAGCIAGPAGLLGETAEFTPSPTEVRASITNTPPVADAGLDLVVTAGEVVVLNGSNSDDADGQRLSYTWQQVSGEPVELKGAYSSFPRFDAPADLDAETTLSFRLMVIDGFAFAADEVTVTVQPAQ
jgi:hypothetical protein